MGVSVHISDGPLQAATPPRVPGAGATLVFEGIVRAQEAGKEIAALYYQTYEPMAQRMITSIAEDLIKKHGLLAIDVEHSRGRVGVGECSFRLRVSSRHRKEGIAAADEFIDRLKADVPIWKSVAT
jgi:molybdopterin synthase catalytic subunit